MPKQPWAWIRRHPEFVLPPLAFFLAGGAFDPISLNATLLLVGMAWRWGGRPPRRLLSAGRGLRAQAQALLKTVSGTFWRFGAWHHFRAIFRTVEMGGEEGFVQAADPLEEIELSGRSSRLASRSP